MSSHRSATGGHSDDITCDIAVIGSGMGGGTLAWALRDSGADVLVVERGDHLPREEQNWSAEEVFAKGRYKNAEPWIDESTGAEFLPGVHYYVGGNTKVYGACLPRFREEDFAALEHAEGTSPAWPVTYAEMEPHYLAAERLLAVHGSPGGDPTEPWRSGDYPYPALEHEPAMADLAARLGAQGLNPFLMPTGVDLRDGGSCLRCRTCDGFPCKVGAKSDAETRAVRPAVDAGVRLMTRTRIRRLETSGDGRRVVAAVAEVDGRIVRIRAGRFVLAAGAVNTAALLLASGHGERGLANSSDLVGRRYMVHNSTLFVAVDPRRRNDVMFQKTLGINDWYLAGSGTDRPLGNLQMLGKLRAPMIKAARRWVPTPALRYLTDHSVDIYLTTEDLPDPENRMVLRADGRIGVRWRANNLAPHGELVKRVSAAMRAAGYPLVFSERMNIATNSHQCGTAVMGTDPATSVVDPTCRAHDLDNLWITDSSVFPSSAALNPALTIAANALRVASLGALTA
ncbi:GMC family oxidoreductase [Micromonospora purpureochromogenes]|uniref:GMC family oxidoreductase n=1 Tax=Micromonospora purpureochromogenes TaxID=47872 RepID=UPI0033E26D43